MTDRRTAFPAVRPPIARPALATALATTLAATLLACAPGHPSNDAGPADRAAAELAARIHRVETGLLPLNVVAGEATGHAVEDRLRFYRVPGVSVAVIDGGRIAWARAWGETAAGSGVAVDTATLFQAASISKPVAAAGALRLVGQGLLDLDGDVNDRLRSWRLPENGHMATEKVTLRRLLSHTAGTTVHGFPGYAAGVELPTLVQLLDGAAPANTGPVRVDIVPGSRWRYSGGGTSVAQLLMSDVTGRDFAGLMADLVLRPAGMRHSTFAQPLPTDRAGDAATAHRADGAAIPGGWHAYPEQAAAGLWTTPSDLARFAIEVQRALDGQTDRFLSPDQARLMTTRQAADYGLGFGLDGDGDGATFGHGGSNAGFQSRLVATLPGPRGGRGAVVMTNGDAGVNLAMEILRAIAREYDLPGFEPRVRDAVAIDPADAARIAGDYYAGGDRPALRIRLDPDGALRAEFAGIGWRDRTLRSAPDGTLFFLENAGELTLERDADGAVVAATVTGLGQPTRLRRQ